MPDPPVTTPEPQVAPAPEGLPSGSADTRMDRREKARKAAAMLTARSDQDAALGGKTLTLPPQPADVAGPPAEPPEVNADAVPPPEGETRPEGAEGAEGEEDTKTAAPADPPEDEKKTRAQEYADLKRAKQLVAKREREAKRMRDEVVSERAELQKVQQGLAELNELKKTNPYEFLKRVTDGDPRRVLRGALAEDDISDEDREKIAMKKELEDMRAMLSGFQAEQKTAAEAKEAEEKKQKERDYHERNQARTKELLEGTKPNDYPYIHAYGTETVSQWAYSRVLTHYQKTGVELDLHDVFSQIDNDLKADHEKLGKATSSGDAKSPPARGNGADKTAKPGAGNAPPTLSSEAVTSRASGERRLTREERMRAAASRLNRHT